MNDDSNTTITYSISDYSGWVSGTRVSLYLDPEERHVYSCGIVGSGTPAVAYHGLHMGLGSVPADAVPESLEEWLRGREDTLAAICDGYLGSEWDGNNHVGRWTEEAQEAAEQLDQELCSRDEQEIATYWDAAEYLSPAESDVVDAVLATGSVEETASDEESTALSDAGVHLRGTEEAVRAILESRLERLSDSHDAAERLERLRIRRVLAGQVAA